MNTPAPVNVSRIDSPLRLPCGAVLGNRLAKAAMSEQLARHGSPSDEMIRLYERWGRGGAGLLISGHVMIDPRRLSEAGNVVADARHHDALARWARTATKHGAHAWVQLNHPGRQTPRMFDRAPVAPSPVPMGVGGRAFAPPRALTEAEIWTIVDQFANAAALMQRAGFTGVELNGAHGYLISQFLSPHTNRRDDAWGGDALRRRRFLLEVVRAVRAAVSDDFAVAVKLNSADFQRGGFSQEQSLEVIAALNAEGIDLLEISGGTYEKAAMFSEHQRESTQKREAFFLQFAERARAVAKMPLMLTGGFRTADGMNQALASGAIDVVGMARPLALEPDLPAALLSGTRAAAIEVQLSTGRATLDSMITGSWYQHQLRRMGRGCEPKPSLSRTAAIVHYLIDYLRHGRARVRRARMSQRTPGRVSATPTGATLPGWCSRNAPRARCIVNVRPEPAEIRSGSLI